MKHTIEKTLTFLAVTLAMMFAPHVNPCMGDDNTAEEKITFDEHIGPLLRKRCSTCHNTNKKTAGLDVTNLANLMEGGSSGSGIEAGDASSSYLFSLVSYEDGPEMPPGGKIPDAEVELLRKWIDSGALENSGSKAVIKPKFDMALADTSSARPEVTPMPNRLPIEPALRTKRPAGVNAIATSPWAPLVALAAPKQIVLHNTQTRQILGVLPTTGQTHSLRFSRNGSVLIAGGGIDGSSGNATLWDVVSGEQIGVIGDELDAVLCADISPDQSLVALSGPSKVVKIFSTADGSLLYEMKQHTDWVTSLEFSPDGNSLVSGDRNGGVHLWYTEDGSEHLTLKGHSKMITDVSWRTDGKLVATASEDTSIRLWEVENGKQIKTWNSHAPGITSLEFGRDGTLVTGGRDKVVRRWKQDGTQLQQHEGLNDVVMSTSWCDESQRVIAGDWIGRVIVWSDTKVEGELNPNPPTVNERLAWNQKLFNDRQEALQPLLETSKQLEEQVASLTGALQAAREEHSGMQTAITQLETQMSTSKTQLASTLSEQDAWRKELDEKNRAKPLVAESHQKAAEALAALPNDEDLKTATAKLGKKVKSLEALTGELDALVQKSNQEKAETERQVKQVSESVSLKQQEFQAATQKVNDLQAKVGSANDILAQHRKKVSAAQTLVDHANKMVARWQGELQFMAQLKTIKQDLAIARAAYEAKVAEAAKAQLQLEEVEQQATFARNVQSEAQQKVEALHKQLRELHDAKK